ncbi:MAG: AbrB/MazE/SpoVT family DNA-binding domain-containing protein [bacterium]|nr:AbrB/MazE/SpoVT family DNA-binding domain-containing protein [bacterium]
MHQNKEQIVSITSQGQINIPKSIRKSFGIRTAIKAIIWKKGDKIIVAPRQNFSSLAGSLRSKVKLNDRGLKKAREAFRKAWPRQ